MRLNLIAAAFMLSACTMTLPVAGRVESSGETFTGHAKGHMDGAGELTIVSSTGVTCTGLFVYTNAREGEGTFKCSDGRSGPFHFVSTGTRGTGTGRLGDQPFTFTFG